MRDHELVTAHGPLRVFTLLHSAVAVLPVVACSGTQPFADGVLHVTRFAAYGQIPR